MSRPEFPADPKSPHVRITLAEIYRHVLEIDNNTRNLPKIVDDHEGRLRNAEQKLALIGAGSGGLAALIVSLAVSLLERL